jgi:signal transduction histidine kinase/ActR/RegA family two-component response regulator
VSAEPEPVLIFAPVGRDAALTRELLARASVRAEVCQTIAGICEGIRTGAAAVILTEEAFEHDDFERIAEALRAQPPWSDIAVLLFAGSEGRTPSSLTVAAIERLPNVTLLDRPIGVAVAISIVRAAIRARARQLQVRDLLTALDQARRQAEAASRLKDEFLATLSHELRTPLNAILGWTAMLRQGMVHSSAMRRGLEVIDRNARAQAQLVEDVLDMARIITGNLRVDLKPLLIHAVIEAAVEALKPTADAKRIEIVVERRNTPALIRGDANRLQQVMWNLLSNAVKFTPDGGRVTVRTTNMPSQVRIEVSDTGVGIAPEFLPFVFDRFRQADQSATRGHGGLGLGLAIVKHLLELHGGTVSVQSAGIGRGATFTLDLPVPSTLSGRSHVEAPVKADILDIQLPGRRVLVVDDDAATRELLAALFERVGAVTVTADCAPAAFDAVQAEAPDLIIADVGLPGEDGCSLMRRIRALPPPACDVPAIALSAYTRAEDRNAARAAGFTHFIGKPAALPDLLADVVRLLPPDDSGGAVGRGVAGIEGLKGR